MFTTERSAFGIVIVCVDPRSQSQLPAGTSIAGQECSDLVTVYGEGFSLSERFFVPLRNEPRLSSYPIPHEGVRSSL